MSLYSIKHTTRYEYQYPVSVSHHAVYLEPMNLQYQRCLKYALTADPVYLDYRNRIDYFGNTLGLFSIQEDYQVLTLTSESVVKVSKQIPEIATIPITCGHLVTLSATLPRVFFFPKNPFSKLVLS